MQFLYPVLFQLIQDGGEELKLLAGGDHEVHVIADIGAADEGSFACFDHQGRDADDIFILFNLK